MYVHSKGQGDTKETTRNEIFAWDFLVFCGRSKGITETFLNSTILMKLLSCNRLVAFTAIWTYL
jgi:hypothetical protein